MAARSSEIAAGSQAQILVLWGGEVRNERALFGRRDDASGALLTSERRAQALHGAQAAVWETQRCLVPISGFRLDTADGSGGRWICEDPGPLFAAGLRSAMQTREGFHLSCFSLLTEAGEALGHPAEVPVLIGADDVIEWFYLDGAEAMRRASQLSPRRFVGVDSALRRTPLQGHMH
ncbi:putative SOS response-associated peptidase YedK [Xanthomonas translucens]